MYTPVAAVAIVDRESVMPTHTHTYATLEVSRAAFDDVKERLCAVEYEHAFRTDLAGEVTLIDMHGIALVCTEEGVEAKGIPANTVAGIIRERDALRRALIEHRRDMHGGSRRPCGTCQESAQALGIRVPDHCAYAEFDKPQFVEQGNQRHIDGVTEYMPYNRQFVKRPST